MHRNIWLDLDLHPLRFSVILTSLLLGLCLFEGQTVLSLKFQTSNLNAGRARLVLYQGKTRHEVIGRTCPVGLAFRTPQLFSCACVTGVWAFYDIMCAAPLQIIGGVDHCFKMPLDTYIQQAILVSNPTRAHGDSLTAFDGDMESIHNKFFRETHSKLSNPDRLLAVGHQWTLRGPKTGKEVCLDSSKNKIFEEAGDAGDIRSYNSAYCRYGNASKSYLKDIGSVTVGCKENTKRVEPDYCYPFLESNSEEVCTDVSLLEAYEMAVEDENNDLGSQNKTHREFKIFRKRPKTTTAPPTTTTFKPKKTKKKQQDNLHLVNGEKDKSHRNSKAEGGTSTATTSGVGSSSASSSSHKTPSSKKGHTTPLPPSINVKEKYRTNLNGNDLVENSTESLTSTSSEAGLQLKSVIRPQRQSTMSNLETSSSASSTSEDDEDDSADEEDGLKGKKGLGKINPLSDNQLNEGDDIDDPTQRLNRNTESDGKDPTKLDEAGMKQVYEETVKDADNFLVLSGTDSNKVVLTHVWEYQQEQIKKALKLKTEADYQEPKIQIWEMLGKVVNISMKTCQALPQGFLKLAMATFLKIQEKEYRWQPPFFTEREFAGIMSALDKCSNEAMPFGFVKTKGSACARKNPDELFVGGQREKIEIPEKIKSEGFEPLIEALWKISINAIVYCDSYLNPDFRSSSKFHMALMEMFRNQIHFIWFRDKVSESGLEYGGVIGDTSVILKDLDLCLVAAKKETRTLVEYSKPEFVPPAGWVPKQEETTTEASAVTEPDKLRDARRIETDIKDMNNLLTDSDLRDAIKNSRKKTLVYGSAEEAEIESLLSPKLNSNRQNQAFEVGAPSSSQSTFTTLPNPTLGETLKLNQGHGNRATTPMPLHQSKLNRTRMPKKFPTGTNPMKAAKPTKRGKNPGRPIYKGVPRVRTTTTKIPTTKAPNTSKTTEIPKANTATTAATTTTIKTTTQAPNTTRTTIQTPSTIKTTIQTPSTIKTTIQTPTTITTKTTASTTKPSTLTTTTMTTPTLNSTSTTHPTTKTTTTAKTITGQKVQASLTHPTATPTAKPLLIQTTTLPSVEHENVPSTTAASSESTSGSNEDEKEEESSKERPRRKTENDTKNNAPTTLKPKNIITTPLSLPAGHETATQMNSVTPPNPTTVPKVATTIKMSPVIDRTITTTESTPHSVSMATTTLPPVTGTKATTTTTKAAATLATGGTPKKARRRRRAIAGDPGFISNAEANWRKQRTTFGDLAYCLKKFEDVKVHLGQTCDE